MKMLDIEDDKMSVKETTRPYRFGSKEEFDLWSELCVALELMEENDKNFNYIESCQGGDGLDFSIVTPYPHGLPERVGTLFFNISPDFSVKVKETSQYTYDRERHFQIKIKKI